MQATADGGGSGHLVIPEFTRRQKHPVTVMAGGQLKMERAQ
jgi:hypothetical protein